MLEYIFHRKEVDLKPPYIEDILELEKMQIVRLKGNLDQSMISLIERRIQDDRRRGGAITKNILLDFEKVNRIDTATIAFYIIRIKEYQATHHTLAFINVNETLKAMLEMFKTDGVFKIYDTYEQAISELNQ